MATGPGTEQSCWANGAAAFENVVFNSLSRITLGKGSGFGCGCYVQDNDPAFRSRGPSSE
jgi:hypothetical protein